ncbi:Alpha-1,3-mannosyltransferase-like protein, partial [Tulasnella sp. 403]
GAIRQTIHLGGYDPRLRDNIDTLIHLTKYCERQQLTYCVIPNKTSPAPTLTGSTGSAEDSDVVFILNFTTAQRQYLLHSPTTLCLLYTPGNEHFGIGPVEGMACGLPVVACTSGGPTESLVDYASHSLEGNSKRPIRVQGTAWLRDPNPEEWERALEEVLKLSESERQALSDRAKERAKQKFSMEEMCKGFERALVQAIDMGPATEHVISWKATRIFLISFIFALLCSWRLQ